MNAAASKPEGKKLGWNVLSSRHLFEGKMFKLRADEIQISGHAPSSYEYEERAPAVIIVPVTAEGEIVLIRQYRYPVDAWCLETPAGGTHDTGGMPLEEVVRKELCEEIGAVAGAVEKVAQFYAAPAFADEVSHVFVAWEIELSKEPERERGEAIELRIVPAAQAMKAARGGEVTTGPCALALLTCEPLLRKRGFLA
ncbi:MAG TPA: NUDIX hydrolase [Chthoniobacteraceae bacterium]|jgi:ADP-ribose pyrophosphatase